MTDTTDRHGRKSNNPVWEGDVHADCNALETVLAAQLATARTVTQRLLDGWEWDPTYVPEGFVGPGGYWIHPNGDIWPPAPGEAAWLAGTIEPADDNTP